MHSLDSLELYVSKRIKPQLAKLAPTSMEKRRELPHAASCSFLPAFSEDTALAASAGRGSASPQTAVPQLTHSRILRQSVLSHPLALSPPCRSMWRGAAGGLEMCGEILHCFKPNQERRGLWLHLPSLRKGTYFDLLPAPALLP